MSGASSASHVIFELAFFIFSWLGYPRIIVAVVMYQQEATCKKAGGVNG